MIKAGVKPPLVKGRANHAGLPSTVPPDNPARRVDIIDIEEVVNKVIHPGWTPSSPRSLNRRGAQLLLQVPLIVGGL